MILIIIAISIALNQRKYKLEARSLLVDNL
jgi:hypothetical protein